MANTHLADPAFWEDVEAADLKQEIDKLAALTSPTKGEAKKLTKLRLQLEQIKEEAIRLATLNAKWQKGEEGKTPSAKLELPDELCIGLFEPSPERDPNKFYCAYCGAETDYSNATRGNGKLQIKTETEVSTVDGELRITEKTRATVPKILACPKCCLEVRKPIIVSRV